jgi:hypothetical protein
VASWRAAADYHTAGNFLALKHAPEKRMLETGIAVCETKQLAKRRPPPASQAGLRAQAPRSGPLQGVFRSSPTLVWILDLKFLSERAAKIGGTSNPPHSIPKWSCPFQKTGFPLFRDML